MKKTTYADPLQFVSSGKPYTADLEAGVDTTKTGYNAYVRYTSISTITTGTGADAKTRVFRIPVTLGVFVPFGLLEAAIAAALTAFFDMVEVILVSGTTLTTPLSDAEPLGKIKAELAEIINLVDLPGDDSSDPQIDEDMTENE